jgi:hypothetical protein
MTRLLLATFAVAALAGPALADNPRDSGGYHHAGVENHMAENRMAAHQHPEHCTIRHHHRICRR